MLMCVGRQGPRIEGLLAPSITRMNEIRKGVDRVCITLLIYVFALPFPLSLLGLMKRKGGKESALPSSSLK